MRHLIEQFETFLRVEKNASPNTINSYISDLEQFANFLTNESVTNFNEVNHAVIRVYLSQLYENDLSRRSVSENYLA